MTNQSDTIVSRLTSQADAIARLAQDQGGFAAAVAAFEVEDANAFRWVLGQQSLLPYCELICEWVRTKLCVLRCVRMCGPPLESPLPSLPDFAAAIAKLANNDDAISRIVDALGCEDPIAYRALLDELALGPFCQLICNWVCSVEYLRICEVICSPRATIALSPVSEIRNAARLFASILARKDKGKALLAALNEAVASFNCEQLTSTISDAGFASHCEIICRLLCLYRRVWVCRELCRVPIPVLTGVYAVEEARNFALALRQLTSQPRLVADLVTAVGSADAKLHSQIVGRAGLEAYCLQICAWVTSVYCYELCSCVCPPPSLNPWFTSVGNFNIYSDIDSASGLANKTKGGAGGVGYAFYGQLQLGGFCPAYSPTSSGQPMRYRFLYSTQSTSLAAGISAIDTSLTAAPVTGTLPATPFMVATCSPGLASEIMQVTHVAGSSWTVLRGQQGTTAASANTGSALLIDPQPITDGLICEVQLGNRTISWPEDSGGLPSTTFTSFPQPVVLSPTAMPAPPGPPVAPSPWVAPQEYYIQADPNGWIDVDPNAIGGGYSTLLCFDTTQPGAVPGGQPIANALSDPGGAPAGTAVSASGQKTGTNVSIIFQATRTTASVIDFSNSLCLIRVNNWTEVNNLWLSEFGTSSCCTPIDTSLSVQFTVDHEELNVGSWSLAITSCSTSAPGTITPPNPTAGVTFTAGGRGANGTIAEDTSTWSNCSYTVTLTTIPALTTGIVNRSSDPNSLTFCICGHSNPLGSTGGE